MIGSGSIGGGFDLSHHLDCSVYLVDGGSEMAIVDAGAGLGIAEMIAAARADGRDVSRIKYLLLTHKHCDHAGGAAGWHETLGLKVLISARSLDAIRGGDEEAVGLPVARRGGMYPADYRLRPCPTAEGFREGDAITVGACALRVIATPGHSADHVSFWTEIDGSAHLFAGDALFYGGSIILQNTPDCDLRRHMESIVKLSAWPVEAFLPGHGLFSLRGGARHIRMALDVMDRGGTPPNRLSP